MADPENDLWGGELGAFEVEVDDSAAIARAERIAAAREAGKGYTAKFDEPGVRTLFLRSTVCTGQLTPPACGRQWYNDPAQAARAKGAARPALFALHQAYLEARFDDVVDAARKLLGQGVKEETEVLDLGMRAALRCGRGRDDDVVQMAKRWKEWVRVLLSFKAVTAAGETDRVAHADSPTSLLTLSPRHASSPCPLPSAPLPPPLPPQHPHPHPHPRRPSPPAKSSPQHSPPSDCTPPSPSRAPSSARSSPRRTPLSPPRSPSPHAPPHLHPYQHPRPIRPRRQSHTQSNPPRKQRPSRQRSTASTSPTQSATSSAAYSASMNPPRAKTSSRAWGGTSGACEARGGGGSCVRAWEMRERAGRRARLFGSGRPAGACRASAAQQVPLWERHTP